MKAITQISKKSNPISYTMSLPPEDVAWLREQGRGYASYLMRIAIQENQRSHVVDVLGGYYDDPELVDVLTQCIVRVMNAMKRGTDEEIYYVAVGDKDRRVQNFLSIEIVNAILLRVQSALNLEFYNTTRGRTIWTKIKEGEDGEEETDVGKRKSAKSNKRGNK
jgi:hypothetical protein